MTILFNWCICWNFLTIWEPDRLYYPTHFGVTLAGPVPRRGRGGHRGSLAGQSGAGGGAGRVQREHTTGRRRGAAGGGGGALQGRAGNRCAGGAGV